MLISELTTSSSSHLHYLHQRKNVEIGSTLALEWYAFNLGLLFYTSALVVIIV